MRSEEPGEERPAAAGKAFALAKHKNRLIKTNGVFGSALRSATFIMARRNETAGHWRFSYAPLGGASLNASARRGTPR